MNKKNVEHLIIMLFVIIFAIIEWKWFSVLLCLYIVLSILYQEIKGIEGNDK